MNDSERAKSERDSREPTSVREQSNGEEKEQSSSILSIESWPAVKPVFRRNRAAEAQAFFAFAERLRQEAQPPYGAIAAASGTPVAVDPPDPDDNALMGDVPTEPDETGEPVEEPAAAEEIAGEDEEHLNAIEPEVPAGDDLDDGTYNGGEGDGAGDPDS